MDWPELLDHPLWTQVLKEEEDVQEGDEEEEDEEGDQEEKNGCEGVGSASSRCVDILFCERVIMHTLMVDVDGKVSFKPSPASFNPLGEAIDFDTPFIMMLYNSTAQHSRMFIKTFHVLHFLFFPEQFMLVCVFSIRPQTHKDP